MAVTAKFGADFATFQAAVDQAEVRLLSFEGNANKVAASLQKMADSYNGRATIQEATLAAEAVQQLGGVSTLTAAEQDKLSASLDKAIEKMKAIGQEVPPSMQAMADSVRKVPPEVDSVKSAFGGMSDQIIATTAGMVSAQAVLGAASTAWHELEGFVLASVAAYAKQEDAEVKLTAALKQHGVATPQVIDQYNQLATSFQNTTKYADEDINAMEALLTLVGNVMPSQMQGALKASTDLAAGLGIDLQKATMLVAKAADGHIETLGRYGITVDRADFSTRGFAAVLDVVNTKFGGQAAAQIETYSGKVAQIGNAWDNVEEALGRIIIEDPLVSAALKHIVDAAKGADVATKDAAPSIADLAAKIGLIDPVTADAIDGLTLMIGPVEGLDKATAKAAGSIDSQAGSIAKLAAAMQNPGITEGLRIQAGLVKEHEAALKADEEALKKYKEAQDEIAQVGQGWRGTLETLSGAVAEGIKYYLEAGVAQDKLAAFYGVTATQVKAVASELKDETEAGKAALDFEKLAFDRRMEIYKIEATEREKKKELVNAAILAERDAQVKLNAEAGLNAAGAIKLQSSAYDELMIKLATLHERKVDGISQEKEEQLLYNEFTKATLAEAQAQDTAAAATNRSADAMKNAAEQTQSATDKFNSFKNTLVLGISDIESVNAALSKFYDQLAAQGNIGTLGVSGVGIATGSGVGQARAIKSFDVGGPTGAGGPAILHEDEFVVPKGGALVLGGGGGSAASRPIAVTLMLDSQILARVVTREQSRDAQVNRSLPAL